MKTKIISAFPGTGKSYFKQNSELNVLDSDSSKFSWIEKGVRHPDFPQNYINHIKENIGKVDIILVSSHANVRNALMQEGIYFWLMFPEIDLKNEYIKRFKARGNDQNFIDMLDIQWDSFIKGLERQPTCKIIRLKSGEFLSDYIND